MKTEFEYVSTDGKTQTAVKKDAEEKQLRAEQRQSRMRLRWKFLQRASKLVLPLILLVVFLLIFRNQMFYTVDSGEILVMYYRFMGGTSHNEIGHEGLHIVAPWDKAYIYKIRTQSIVVPMTVLAKNGIEVHLEAQMRFHPVPETVPYLHREYGPDYVKDIIIPELIESVQDVIGSFLPEELYSSQRGASSGRIFSKAKRTIGGVFVQVDDIALFNIKLPDKVQESIQNKATAEQNAIAYGFRVLQEQRETERKLLEARGMQQYNDIVKNIPQSVLIWKGIEATLELAKSPNAKVIVMGGKDSLPLVLGNVPDLAAK